MASSISKIPLIRWELKNFRNQLLNNKNKYIISDSFDMGSFRFALFFNPIYYGHWIENTYGLMLKDPSDKKSVEVSFKLWLENEQGQRIYQNSVEKHMFKKMDDQCKFTFPYRSTGWNLFCEIKDNSNKPLIICCEPIGLNEQVTVPVIDCTQQFYQNIWSMCEQGKYDAVIKLGKTEFKISKFPFMAQSGVFDQMFSSAFKEGKTSTIEVKDVSEKAMQQLIKWMCTCRIEDESVVEELFEVADKYQVNLLKTTCVEIMINSFDNSNAFQRLILAVIHKIDRLKNSALKYIGKMSKNEVIAYLVSSEWSDFVQKKPAIGDEIRKVILEKFKK